MSGGNNYVRRLCGKCASHYTYDTSGLCCRCRPKAGRKLCPVCGTHNCQQGKWLCLDCLNNLKRAEKDFDCLDERIIEQEVGLTILKLRKQGLNLFEISKRCGLSISEVYIIYISLLSGNH